MSPREFLQRNYDNEVKLRQYADLIWLFFKKMLFYKPDSLEFVNQDYRWLHRDYQNVTHLEMTMQEIIDNDRYLIEFNGPDYFFTFTYGEYRT